MNEQRASVNIENFFKFIELNITLYALKMMEFPELEETKGVRVTAVVLLVREA